jgi:hypothetical protein
MSSAIDQEQLKTFVNKQYDETIVTALEEYIKIPNLSPSYDENFATNGLQVCHSFFTF